MQFSASIEIIDINPFVFIPDDILKKLQHEVKKDTGPIPVKLVIGHTKFTQTLVKFRGAWRLYLNTTMRKISKKEVGDTITIDILFDQDPPKVSIPEQFQVALDKNSNAKKTFLKLPAFRQKEINRYITHIKSSEKQKEIIQKTIQFLDGEDVNGVLFRDLHHR